MPAVPIVSVTNAVAGASGQTVVNAGALRIGNSIGQWPFLPTNSNLTGGNALPFIENIHGTIPTSVQMDELADYLVLSTCGHAFDGWRYFSQAAISLLNGARNNALHLAYYAELRAALSILAGSGIGILNKKHFVLTSSGSVDWFNGSTHTIAWEALKEWSKNPVHALKVIKNIEAFGMKADEWASACNAASSLQEIATHWLTNWSVDLAKIGDDRNLRNEASYRPDLSPSAFAPLGHDEINLVLGISSGCEFSGSGRFEIIDTALIHDLCSKACVLREGTYDRIKMANIWRSVFAWLQCHKQMSKTEAITQLRQLIHASHSSASCIIQKADPSFTNAGAVLSRAFLLLRLASTLTRQQWIDIRTCASGGQCQWQSTVLNSFGAWSNFWAINNQSIDCDMLEADRIDAEDEVNSWLQRSRPIVPFYKVWRDIPLPAINLCRFERTGILAVAP